MSLSQTITHLQLTHRPAECEAYRRERAEREYAEAREAYLLVGSQPHRTGCKGQQGERYCSCSRRFRLREARDRQKAAWEKCRLGGKKDV